MASSTKNIKGNRKVVMVTLHSPEIIFKIPDGLDLEDKNVVEYWGHKWGKMYIKYVGKEEEEEIEAYEEGEVDYKYEQQIEIVDADEHCVDYSEDEEEDDEEEHICGETGGHESGGCGIKFNYTDGGMFNNTSFCMACFEKKEEEED